MPVNVDKAEEERKDKAGKEQKWTFEHPPAIALIENLAQPGSTSEMAI
jgi:hypothetical protein